MLKVASLISGSSGNASFIKSEPNINLNSTSSSTSLLIDVGASGKRLEEALVLIGESSSDLTAILVTHEHIDHVRGLGVLARRYRLPLYMTYLTWEQVKDMGLGIIKPELLRLFEAGDSFEINDLHIKSFSVSHDAADTVGYRIENSCGTVSMMTDVGFVDKRIVDELTGSDLVLIESNYDKDMLYEGSYPWNLKQRIDGDRGHLSNEQCASTIKELLDKGTKKFFLSHLSEENNTPDKAFSSTVERLADAGAVLDLDYFLQVSPRYRPGNPSFIGNF